MFTIRRGTLENLEAIAMVEQECFPVAEAATKEEFEERLTYYADHFWLLFDEKRLVAFIDGFVNEGITPKSSHGGVAWNQMRLTFLEETR